MAYVYGYLGMGLVTSFVLYCICRKIDGQLDGDDVGLVIAGFFLWPLFLLLITGYGLVKGFEKIFEYGYNGVVKPFLQKEETNDGRAKK